ncbi:MAG: alpha/beta hydrolase family protein [Myxococcales bacterium]|nr:alpha/beta hydrolase family protein [Myxococcales bacterium]
MSRLAERVASRVITGADLLMRSGLRRLIQRHDPGPLTADALDELLRELGRYNDPAVLADPDRLLAPPPVKVELVARAHRRLRGGQASHYTFASPYRPLHPGYAEEYARYDRVDRVHVHAWEHAHPAPASIVLVHGWAVGARRLHEIEFSVPLLFHRLGLDVYFYVHPFHGERTPSQARFGGQLHPSTDLVRTNEGFIQTCQELRTLLSLIGERRGNPIGMMGSSLGGYTSALIASLDPRLAFVVPIMAPASLAELFWDHGGHDPRRAAAEAAGMTRARFHQAWALHSPLTYQPKVPWERRMIVGAGGDALVTPRHVDVLWEHWQRPRRFTFFGGHILQVGRRAYVHELGRFLGELGLVRDHPPASG